MGADHGCRGAPLKRACRAASISGVSEANRRRTSSGSWSHATDTENSPSEAVLVETVPDSVPPSRETLVFPAVFLEIRIPPSPLVGFTGRIGRPTTLLHAGAVSRWLPTLPFVQRRDGGLKLVACGGRMFSAALSARAVSTYRWPAAP